MRNLRSMSRITFYALRFILTIRKIPATKGGRCRDLRLLANRFNPFNRALKSLATTAGGAGTIDRTQRITAIHENVSHGASRYAYTATKAGAGIRLSIGSFSIRIIFSPATTKFFCPTQRETGFC